MPFRPLGRKERLNISTRQVEDQVLVSIKDSGCGMDTDTRTRIFEPFFTTKDVGEGTGLGLSISYGIIEQHGGTISVHSQTGARLHF